MTKSVASRRVDRAAHNGAQYLHAALPHIPRLLGSIDRNPYRPTYGCLDRQYWHYRTSSFPSEMYQEGALPLALIYAFDFPGNRWGGNPRIKELAAAALRFSARSRHADGSCDDYYPFERALGAAAFSFAAATETYRLLNLDDSSIRTWLRRRARWLMNHGESGRLSNHHALVALGLCRLADITHERELQEAAEQRVRELLTWQSPEGWFDEYGGADPGYQTVTIDCLAKYRQLAAADWLDEPLDRAVAFSRLFLHPDGSYAGEYGSRGTYHFYPHGFELLAQENAEAAQLADGFRHSLSTGTAAHFDDDRMYVHRLGNLLEAYRDARPRRSATGFDATPRITFLPQAGLLVFRAPRRHTVVSTARGGVFKHFADGQAVVTDAGLIAEFDDGRVAVSQMHDRQRAVEFDRRNDAYAQVVVHAPFHEATHETATVVKQAVFHLGMITIGRWCRTLVRKLLQKRVITARRPVPLKLTRRLILRDAAGRPGLRVLDTIELTGPGARVRRMSFGVDHQSAYVAASGVYQSSVLAPWTSLEEYVHELNACRRVQIVREFD